MSMTTKDRILDAAEVLFAQNGFASTSLRMLTERAGVNLAAVNYHFQSKDALVQAVLYRRVNPLNQRRFELLDAALARAGTAPPVLEEILDAFYRPPIEMALATKREGKSIVALLGRIYTEPGDLVLGQLQALMSEAARRFHEAILLAMPHLTPGTAFWRLQFCVGAITHTFGAMAMVEGMARGRISYDDPEEVLRQMVTFAAGGLRA